jgi:hypothetical protein
MVLWYACGAVFAVWNVFQSPGLDYRLVALGALAPLVLDAPFGAQAYAHTLVSAVLVLGAVMALTAGRGRRLVRRRAIGLVIGWFAGLVLAASWIHEDVFWWPWFGADRPDAPLLPGWPAVALEEAAGLAAGWWAWVRFGLGEPSRRRAFVRTGRLAVAGEAR